MEDHVHDREDTTQTFRTPPHLQPAISSLHAFAELLDFRHLISDSLFHPIEAFYAYNLFPKFAMFGSKTFAVSDIPNLANKVILVTGGASASTSHVQFHKADSLRR